MRQNRKMRTSLLKPLRRRLMRVRLRLPQLQPRERLKAVLLPTRLALRVRRRRQKKLQQMSLKANRKLSQHLRRQPKLRLRNRLKLKP